MINEEKLDRVLLDLGHDHFNRGTAYLREAVKLRAAGAGMMCKEIYPGIAHAHNTSAAGVERAIRHSVAKAWGRCAEEQRLRFFGRGVQYANGKPAVGEYVATLARICREEIEV